MFGDEKKRKPIQKLIKEGLYRNQRGKCMYCGRKLDLADMHADHKIPFDHDGDVVVYEILTEANFADTAIWTVLSHLGLYHQCEPD